MSELVLTPDVETVVFASDSGLALEGTSAATWQVSQKRGNIAGVAVEVSGSGAFAGMQGSMNFKARRLESSKTYQEMKKSYSIGGGVSAFWSWIGIKANAETHKTEIQTALKEISSEVESDGTVNIDLFVTGQIPGFSVRAMAYVLVLQITDSSGQTYNVASSEDPANNTGAQDSQGNNLPTKDNNSTITL